MTTGNERLFVELGELRATVGVDLQKILPRKIEGVQFDESVAYSLIFLA